MHKDRPIQKIQDDAGTETRPLLSDRLAQSISFFDQITLFYHRHTELDTGLLMAGDGGEGRDTRGVRGR